MDKKILQIKFSFPIPLNAKFSMLPGSGLMRFSQYGHRKTCNLLDLFNNAYYLMYPSCVIIKQLCLVVCFVAMFCVYHRFNSRENRCNS